MYSKQLCPETFPVVDLNNYVLAYPTLLQGNCRLFSGYSQYNHFMHIFRDVLSNIRMILLP